MKRTALLLALLTATLLAPAAAHAAPAVSGEFALPARPKRLALGPDSNIWVTLDDFANDVAMVDPSGRSRPFAIASIAGATGITAGPDGNLWVTHNDGVASFSPVDPVGTARRIDITGFAGQGITTGPDRRIWTSSGDTAFQIDPSTGVVTRHRVLGMAAQNGITAGGDGKLYIADTGSGRIVALTTAGDPSFIDTGGGPQQIAAGAGTQLGYTNPLASPQEVGVFTPGGSLSRAQVPLKDPFGIAFGLDQAYWIANFASSDLTRLTSDGQVTTITGLSADSGPRYLAAGVGGTLWVGLERSQRIALVTGLEAPAPPAPPTDPPPTNPAPPTARPTPPTTPAPGQQPVFRAFTLTRATTVGRAARLSVNVADASTVTIVLEQKLPGRRGRGGRCVRPSRSNRGRRSCSRYVSRGTAEATVRGGVVTATFSRTLAPGGYRVTLSATNAIGTTRAAKSLTVQPRPPRRAARGRARGRGGGRR